MAKAKRPGGLYYVGDKAVDANGNEVTDAPERPADTDPSQQPGARDASTPEERMGIAIAKALQGGIQAAPAPQAASGDDQTGTGPGSGGEGSIPPSTPGTSEGAAGQTGAGSAADGAGSTRTRSR